MTRERDRLFDRGGLASEVLAAIISSREEMTYINPISSRIARVLLWLSSGADEDWTRRHGAAAWFASGRDQNWPKP